MNEQQGDRGQPASDQQVGGTPQPRHQTQRPRPTWGEQTADLDQQRAEGGGGTSSDSDGQQQDDQ